ncbi:hypothetical protein ACFYVL_06170 [Streptomyces sp. NPDC004111]|uniref:hypothetical protein n=1 Tax=Streptomyces sp. NPDC004111 TaxID=3364690 RepID=UPI0036C62CE0
MSQDRPTGTSALTVPEHVYGFPGVGFGGYAAGLLAREAGGAGGGTVQVNFRRPVPLGTPLAVLPAGDGGYEAAADGAVVLTALAHPDVAVPPAVPTWEQALRAVKERPLADGIGVGRDDCWGCGADREPGAGLRQGFGAWDEGRMAVAAWTPDPALNPGERHLSAAQLWGALDCPGGWACRVFAQAPVGTVTVSLTTTVTRPVVLGEDHVTFGWTVSASGRKYRAGSAIVTRDGEVCARAEALWLAPSPLPGGSQRRPA